VLLKEDEVVRRVWRGCSMVFFFLRGVLGVEKGRALVGIGYIKAVYVFAIVVLPSSISSSTDQ
jgi:hypothetical protein